MAAGRGTAGEIAEQNTNFWPVSVRARAPGQARLHAGAALVERLAWVQAPVSGSPGLGRVPGPDGVAEDEADGWGEAEGPGAAS